MPEVNEKVVKNKLSELQTDCGCLFTYKLKHTLAINRNILDSSFPFCHFLLLTLGRFRDAVLPDSQAPLGSGAFFHDFHQAFSSVQF